MKCNFSLKSFRQELLKQAAPIIKNSDMSDSAKKQKLLDTIADISKTMEIGAPNDVEQALGLVTQIFSRVNEAQRPDINLARAAFTAWRNKPTEEVEDNSSDRLNKNQVERFNDDVWETAYGSAMNAKMRAKQQANKVGVQALLYNENGIINSTHDLNLSVQEQQEKLLQNVIEYLKTRVPVEEQISDIFNGKMYKDGVYTGIVERIQSLYEKILGKENFDTMSLNKDFNNKNYQRLDAYSSWIILNNFDTILQQTYGKAIAINPDAPKYTADTNKYVIGGGSNVFNTWRTSEEIDLSKEINNISQAIITSLPLIHANSTTPTDQNIKFNEFVYIIGKIKDLPYRAQQDHVFDITDLEVQNLSDQTKEYIDGKSFLNIINDIRSNPQQILPVIFELLNNSDVRTTLKSEGIINDKTFLDVDLDIINSLSIGLFNGENSLEAVQSKSGYKGVNYFSFITQTIDSIYKAGFLQYFRDPDGKIYVRNMFDQSINNIQFGIQDTINSINSQMFIQNYDYSKYNITDTKQQLTNGTYRITYNDSTYDFTIGNGTISAKNISNGQQVIETSLLYKLADEYRNQKGNPETVNFTINGFHRGPLTVSVNVTNGLITYSVGGQEISAFNNEDYESLSEIIQDVLKQNFIIDQTYFSAFNKGQIGFATTQLMQMVSRVISNQYISNHYLKGLNPRDTRRKVDEIYGNSDAKPTFNKKLNEINLLTEKESGILTLLAQAKALVTGRLTSSQVLDSEGNSLSSSSLSRFMSSIPYQILQQVKQPNSPAKDFTLWNQGVYLGIQQMKEIQDNLNDNSKSLTEFSAKEMEESAIFIDFLQSVMPEKSRTSPIKDGIAAFLPSENSDKTYIGRMMVDLKKIKVGEQSLYDLLKTGKNITPEFAPIVIKELGDFYQKALNNINSDWSVVNNLLANRVINYNNEIQRQQTEFNVEELIPEGDIAYGNWEYLNLVAEKLGTTPLSLLNSLTTEYNNSNPKNPIVLIDQVHYVANKNGSLGVNKSLLENVERFKNPEMFAKFILDQESDLLQTLLKDKVSIDANNDFKILLGENANQWIDPYTGKIILAYESIYDPNTGEVHSYPIRREQDIREGFETNAVHGFTLNPLIANYNLLNYFLTQEFMNSTVGAFYAHPSKDKSGITAFDEKSRKLAQDKRNVSFTAAMHAFQKNLIQGIPDEINIALMPDIIDTYETISGDIFDDIKPFDGATFGNPFFTILENNSLGGARVGINKKTFTHYYDQRTGTGGIIKTAEFPLTNNNIRNSKFYQIMMKNMTDRVWLNEDGTPAIVDITTDYDSQPIIFTNPNGQEQGQLYFQNTNNGKYYAILQIVPRGNNQYFRILQEVDKTGRAQSNQLIEDANGNLYQQVQSSNGVTLLQDINNSNNIIESLDQLQPTEVNTNYKLWKLFGGERAMELKIGDFNLTPTEHSISVVVNIMNNTGTKKSDVVKYQSDIWQPLKHSDIHIMPTVGAVKQGAGNINSLDAYTNADSSKINFMRIKMNQAGIQLDKEHHADGDELSIMTQVLSACASRGYTQEQSQEMYNAMATLTRSAIREYLDAFDEFFQSPNGEAKDKYQKVILDTLLDAFAHNTNSSQMLQMVTQEILNKAKEGKDIEFSELNKIPYSDPSVFRRLHSTISVALTRAAIKIKVDGILSVLQPSYNAIKLYGDRLLGSFINDSEIQALQAERDSDPNYELRNNISQLRIGRTYKIVHPDGSINYTTIKTHNEYYRLKDQLQHYPDSIISIREQFAPTEGFEGGRELAAYNAIFGSLDGRKFNIYDLVSVRQLAYLKAIKASDVEIKTALANVQEDLNKLNKKSGILTIDTGEQIQLDPNSIQIEPYEIVMPKIFKNIFGLDTYDDLNEIKNDSEFFTKRLLDKCKVQIPNSRYSLALLRLNGKHTYLLEADKAIEIPGEFQRKTISLAKDKGKLWRVDRTGKKLYQMNKNDEVWSQIVNGKEVEVIVTRNISSYLQNQKFNTLSISPNSNIDNIIGVLQNSKKKSVRNYLNAVNSELVEGTNYATAIHNMSFNDLKGHPMEHYFRTLGAQIHSSFLKSLEIVAARIPAQSMQSFMPMKVVAYDAPDINTAYVNTAQFLFQGSDLDIDAVSLAAYAFDEAGRYILHSPFASIDTTESLEASENLPFPTGKILEISNSQLLDYSKYVSVGSVDVTKPFNIIMGQNGTEIRLNNSTPESINLLGELIRFCNKINSVPIPTDSRLKGAVQTIANYINEHNNFINDDSVEDFSKNYIVTSMYKIGTNPANLIESQQAMDTITGPLKSVANSTKKAKEDNSLGNVGSFATNIHGITQNMAGKKAVGICAVGLKSYFALTARYNEVLANGTPEEVQRLKSDVEIAGKHFRMLSNAYTTNDVNAAILGEILTQLDQGQDQALVLSALLSLSTDNAKELALDKLNASNFLGMYIYGITIGMNFKTISDIISSDTGLVLNELMSSNVLTGERGLNMQNIFDYIELGPKLHSDQKFTDDGGVIFTKHLDQVALWDLAWNDARSLEEKLQFLEGLKIENDSALNNLIEKAEEYIQQVNTIKNDSINIVDSNGTQLLRYNGQIYQDIKKLNAGGDELRKQGQLLHINQGLETQYLRAINYIETLTSVVSDRKYANYREAKRRYTLETRRNPEYKGNKPSIPSNKWKFNFHDFVSNESYRNAWIDIYGGTINDSLFLNDDVYRGEILKVSNLAQNKAYQNYASKLQGLQDNQKQQKFINEYLPTLKGAIRNNILGTLLSDIKSNLRPSKVFFNILDTMQVPHFFAYLQSADMLHQAMMKTSAKYRAVYTLGKQAIDDIGAYSADDKENILRRTEQFVDRVMRDRFLVQSRYEIRVPRGQQYFIEENGQLVKKTSSNTDVIIQLGTRAGNASFKALMETKIIPDLQEGKIGGNMKDGFISHNAFIKSLSSVLYRQNPEYSITINTAPNINMSPRSDTDRALFEQIKYNFNQLRMSPIRYQIGPNKYDLIELFWLYNQIAFNGRPGENTMTSIFTDLFDYKIIRQFRDFINDFDNNNDLRESISVSKMVREVAPKANLWSTNLKHFYYENPNTGELAYWSQAEQIRGDYSDYGFDPSMANQINGYEPTVLSYLTNEDLRNFVTTTNTQDVSERPLEIPLENGKAKLKIAYGGITEITYSPLDAKGNPDVSQERKVEIPKDKKQFFKKIPTKTVITANGTDMVYDVDRISMLVDNLINCG